MHGYASPMQHGPEYKTQDREHEVKYQVSSGLQDVAQGFEEAR